MAFKLMTFLLSNHNSSLAELIGRFVDPIVSFFRSYGEFGLFIYSIIETITPIAGVEFILVSLIGTSPERWWFITLNMITANAIGASIVYFFMAKPDNRFYNRIVKKDLRIRAEKMFNRYGFWAIFIFAMTPLPFFIIIFTAAIAKMKYMPYIFAVFFSRAVRFYITTYIMYRSVVYTSDLTTGQIVFWLAVIGVGFSLVMMVVQRFALKHFEAKANTELPEQKSA